MKTYTLELTEAERDMLRDFMMSYFADKIDGYDQLQNNGSKIALSLYNKIDNLDPEEVMAS